MQTKLNKSKKITLDNRHEKKANKTGFTILSLSEKSSILNHFDIKHKKTSQNINKQQESM